MQHMLIAASSVVAFIGYIVYIVAILKGNAKPHRTTRFVLILITYLATASLFAEGSTVAVWLSGIFAFGSTIIFLLSLKFGMGGWAKTDMLCLVVSLLGIVIWRATANPMYGLMASIGADLAGQVPMLIKTYRFPETEVWTFYFLGVVAGLLNLAALQHWNIQEVIYPLYIVLIDGATVLLIIRPKGHNTQ